MIHKRNLTITALVLAAIVTAVFLVFPRIYHGTLGWFYVPVLILSVTIAHFITGNGHSPPELVGWISFGIWTLFYWVVFLVLYVILLEIYLLRRVLQHLEDAKQLLEPEKPDSKAAIEKFGRALIEVEARRRKHFLLKSNDSIDLTAAPLLTGARALTKDIEAPLVKKLRKKLESRLAVGSSQTRAHVKMLDLTSEAGRLIADKSSPTE